MQRPLIALALVAAVAAGCGSDGGDADEAAVSTSTSTTTVETTVTSTTETTAAPSTTAAAGRAPASTTTRPPSPTTTTTRAQSAPATTASTTTTVAHGGGRHALTIQNFAFSPAVLQAKAGDEVVATNKDGAAHTWTSDNGAWDSGNLGQNQSFTRRFSTAGTFGYHCKIHPSMKGTVNVSA